MSEKKDLNKDQKKKPSVFAKIGKFFREYRSELKKISWPTFPEVVKNTCITLVVVAIVGAVIWVADFVFGQARNVLVNLERPETSQSDVLGQTEPPVNEAVGELVEATATDAQ